MLPEFFILYSANRGDYSVVLVYDLDAKYTARLTQMRIRDEICEVIARQRWASKRLRTALINFITPEFMTDHDFETGFFGYRYRGNTKNLIDRKVLFSGCHECDVLSFMKDVLVDQDDSVYIDVGANVGHHVLFMCRYASAVFAFEPYQSVRDQLEEKLDLNSVDNVKVVPVALGDKIETRRFFAPPNENLGTGSFIEEYSDQNTADQLLEIRRLDDIFTEQGIEQADMVKIDVEGFEKQVLSGARKMLELMRPIVLFENSMYLDDALHGLQDVKDIFPQDYLFYRFSHSGKRRHGRYRLLELTPEMFRDRRQLALVSVPRERVISLSASQRFIG